MNISGFQKVTLLDYPNKTAAIIFTQGCNFKCRFCQNSLLLQCKKDSEFSENEIIDYLIKRKNVIDGLVISGGEPTIQKNLEFFIRRVKELNILVKLDTNGSNPDILKNLIDEGLIDYVAMDIKNVFDEYGVITSVNNINIDNIKRSIDILKSSSIDHEFRTTIMSNYHDVEKIKKICKYIGKNEKYFLQNYVESENVLDKKCKAFSKDELREMECILKKDFPNVKVRGL